MSKFTSFLSHVGNAFKSGVDYLIKLEPAAEVALSVIDPPVATLLHVTTAAIIATEQKFAGVNQQSGSGAQKLATARNILEPFIIQTFGQYGIKLDTSGVDVYLNAVVALLNTLPPLTPVGKVAPIVNATAQAGGLPIPQVTGQSDPTGVLGTGG